MKYNFLWHMIITRNLEHTRHDPREKFNIVVPWVSEKYTRKYNKDQMRAVDFFSRHVKWLILSI